MGKSVLGESKSICAAHRVQNKCVFLYRVEFSILLSTDWRGEARKQFCKASQISSLCSSPVYYGQNEVATIGTRTQLKLERHIR
jgi:hypothetical protein